MNQQQMYHNPSSDTNRCDGDDTDVSTSTSEKWNTDAATLGQTGRGGSAGRSERRVRQRRASRMRGPGGGRTLRRRACARARLGADRCGDVRPPRTRSMLGADGRGGAGGPSGR